MDNLTHSLVGALLGRMGLKRLTGRAMPTLILAANAPDIDVFTPLLTGEPGLVSHRGFTHGIGGLLLLPLLLAAIMLAWNRLRPSAEPVRPWALLLLAFIGVLSHPVLDWLTSYGTRLFEPFSHRWFYADTLFIIDPLIWIGLIVGLELSWRAEARGRQDWHRMPVAIALGLAAYVGANAVLTVQAKDAAARQLEAQGLRPTLIAAVPQPLQFWTRRILWQNHDAFGSGSYVPGRGLVLEPPSRSDPGEIRRLATNRQRADISAFLFWARMPVVIRQDGRPFLADQRFLGRTRAGFLVPLDSAPPPP